MKIVELLSVGREMLKLMSENDVMIDDWKYVEAYFTFRQMRRNMVKFRVAIRELADKYNVSTRTMERAIKRLEKEC